MPNERVKNLLGLWIRALSKLALISSKTVRKHLSRVMMPKLKFKITVTENKVQIWKGA